MSQERTLEERRTRFLVELATVDQLMFDAQMKATGANNHDILNVCDRIKGWKREWQLKGDTWSAVRFSVGTEHLKTRKCHLRLLIAGVPPVDAHRRASKEARREGWTTEDEKQLQASLNRSKQ